MQHITMFKKSSNDKGHVRCVISPEFTEEFTAMGFSKDFASINKAKPKTKRKAVKDDN